jgi:hypothetical protein
MKPFFLGGLAFTVLFGAYLGAMHGFSLAIIEAPIAGILFGLAIYVFTKSKTVKQQTALRNSADKEILHSGLANHFKGLEACGGRLYLLANELEFQSHSFNIQNHSLSLPLDQIKKLSFYNTLGIIPNGMAIETKFGTTEKFVLQDRKRWKTEIEKHLQFAD